uniref:Uncharacterized protein n=1 Tax=Macaca fascicularis TaxID=9541 RepID=A0A7N9CNX8_MACFA
MPVISALWEAKVGGWLEARSSRPACTTQQVTVCIKKLKIIWVWWCLPIVLDIWEVEVGGLLEPRRSRVQGAIIALLYSSLGDRARSCLKRKKKINNLLKVRYLET